MVTLDVETGNVGDREGYDMNQCFLGGIEQGMLLLMVMTITSPNLAISNLIPDLFLNSPSTYDI